MRAFAFAGKKNMLLYHYAFFSVIIDMKQITNPAKV